jgi:HPt (histidine-containing phosphotransfer) domain-containing protein
MFMLPHMLHLLVSAIAIRLTEKGATAETLPPILGGAVPVVMVAYVLSRTRYARQSGWLYILVNLTLPTLVLFTAGPAGGTSPLVSVPFMVPAVLLASVVEPVAVPLITGIVGLGCMSLITYLVGPPSWLPEMRQSGIFVTIVVVLTVIFAIYRDKLEADRAAELRARNEELEALRKSLEDRVRERTAELSARNNEMRLVFDNMVEGLFTVDKQGVLASERSATLTRWFGTPRGNELFFHYFGRHSSTFAEHAELAWQQLVDGAFGPELALVQMPKTLVANGRTYHFSYQPIDAGERGAFLAFVADVTNEIERENIQRERREAFALFEHMLADRSWFLEFMEEASAIVASVVAGNLESGERNRAIHTLKGDSMMVGLESVARLCHDLESLIATGERPLDAELTTLGDRWKRITADVDRLIGERRQVIEISLEEHRALEETVQRATSREDLLRAIRDLKLEPVERRLRHFADQARAIAARLGKQIEVEISHSAIRLDSKGWSPFWAAFVHAIRNAVDHGIESVDERRASGKSTPGRIALRARREGATIVIGIEDDGRGIDWDAIRRSCAARGLPSRTQDDLCAALFEDGISTAGRVTDVSGRGVGMGALQAAVNDLGGSISVRSEKGLGTQLSMSFPALSATFESVRAGGDADRPSRATTSG